MQEYHEKGEEKVLSTVRLLILVRNILHVPADNDAECRPDNDANLHDQVINANKPYNTFNHLITLNIFRFCGHCIKVNSLISSCI